jgi:hypothetical protein
MRKILLFCAFLLLTGTTLLGQTTLYSQTWASAGIGNTPPAGWGLDIVVGSTNYTYYMSQGTWPTVNPYNGDTRLVDFESFSASSGTENRLKMTTPISTVGYSGISVNFEWYTDNGYPGYTDGVYIQWSTNGSTWTTAGSEFLRYSATNQWVAETQALPAGAAGVSTLYVAFLFYSNYGNDCHLDQMTITSAPPPTVVTLAATGVAGTSATLNGTVNPNGSSTATSFDYGLTIPYASNVVSNQGTFGGTSALPINVTLNGLINNSVYHFRAKGTNGTGTSYGNDFTFVLGCPSAGPAGAISGPSSACQGGTGYVYTVPVIQGATGYTWTVPVGGTIVSGLGTNSITVNYGFNAAPGYVYVYGTAPCGNGSPSQLAITMNPPPTPTITGPASVCVNSTGNIYTTQTGMTNYIWTVSAGGSVTAGGQTGNNTVTITWTTAGTQSVSVNYTNSNGCTALSPTMYMVTVNPLPTPTISGPAPGCTNVPEVYSTQTGMTNYTWGISAGGSIQSGGGTSSITVLWTVTGSQSVSVNYTSAAGCTAPSPTSYPVTVNATTVPVISGPNSVCTNSGYSTYTTQSGMSNYTWTISSGGTISYQNNNSVSVTWTTAGAQWVAVNFTNPSGCTPTSPTQYSVTVNSVPGPAGSITGTATVCAGAQGVSYSVATIANATVYVWTLPTGASIASGANTNNITVNFSDTASSGNITVYGNNICGNGATSPAFAVTVNALPAAAGTITGPATVCQGSTGNVYTVPVILNATGYTWTLPAGATIVSGNNTNSITVDFSSSAVSGDITVAGTNSCGNGNVSPNFAVTVNTAPPAPVVTNTGTTLQSSAATGNQWYFQGTLIMGATGQTYVATQDGYYWDVVTLNGCSSDTSNHKLILTTGINSHSSDVINIYPVPNDGQFNVSIITASEESFTIGVYNTIGVKIYEEPKVDVNGSLQKVIDLRPVPDGVYTIIFENSQNQVVKKIVVSK